MTIACITLDGWGLLLGAVLAYVGLIALLQARMERREAEAKLEKAYQAQDAANRIEWRQ